MVVCQLYTKDSLSYELTELNKASQNTQTLPLAYAGKNPMELK